MNFSYSDHFQTQASTGYETLIYDAMIGDATLYQRADNIEAGWDIVQPVLDAWADGRTAMGTYSAGSDGPDEAETLIESHRCRWRTL
jgi:glucose-6-phosphate 1-dehydrogenase